MKLLDNRDKVGAILLLVFSLFYLRYSFEIPLDPTAGDEFFTPRTLPTGLAVVAMLCSVLQLFMPAPGTGDVSISRAVVGFQWKPALLLILLMAVYSLTFSFFGFVIATFLFLLIGFVILGERRLRLASAVAGGLVLFMWGVLTKLFDLYLDTGTLYRLMVGGA